LRSTAEPPPARSTLNPYVLRSAAVAALALVIRPLVVGPLLLPVRLRPGEKAFIAWGGLKGAVPILLASLALSLLAGLALVVRWIQGRGLLTLVTPEPRVDWMRMLRGAVVWVLFSVIAAAAEHVLFPGRYYLSFDPQRFYQFAAAAIVLTPIQCATEELVFRGYAMQGLALLTRRPALIARPSMPAR
jgi:membrane protease YdiL (CAAX protease family)